MNCNWCGDEMKAGVYEVHKCLQDGEAETASAESTDKCITCNAKKDEFSQEWDYKQCQACSMMSERGK
jgi:hypothetical protein